MGANQLGTIEAQSIPGGLASKNRNGRLTFSQPRSPYLGVGSAQFKIRVLVAQVSTMESSQFDLQNRNQREAIPVIR